MIGFAYVRPYGHADYHFPHINSGICFANVHANGSASYYSAPTSLGVSFANAGYGRGTADTGGGYNNYGV